MTDTQKKENQNKGANLYMNTDQNSVKLLDIDRHFRSGCMCSNESNLGCIRGWTSPNIPCAWTQDFEFLNTGYSSKTISSSRHGAKNLGIRQNSFLSETRKNRLPATSSNSYQTKIQPYNLNFHSHEQLRGGKEKGRSFMFHHYNGVEQYMEQYRMFHSSVPYSEKQHPQKKNIINDPTWDPIIHKIDPPR